MKSKGNFSFEPTVEVGTTVYTCDSGGIKEWRVLEVQLVRTPYLDEYKNVVYPNESNLGWALPSLREVYDLVSFDERNNLTIGIDNIFLTPKEAAENFSNKLINEFNSK